MLKTGSFYIEDATVEARVEAFLRNELHVSRDRERMAPMKIMCERLPEPAMPRLYAGADAFVLPSRGEGWGRPYMEALAMGLPTIASRFSGNLEFMDDATSWLIDGELVPVGEDAELFNSFYAGHKWFEADVDELAAAMREVAGDPAAARAKAAPARERADRAVRIGGDRRAHRRARRRGAREPTARSGAGRSARSSAAASAGGDSLSTVNDGLADELSARGENAAPRRRGPDAQDDRAGADRSRTPGRRSSRPAARARPS